MKNKKLAAAAGLVAVAGAGLLIAHHLRNTPSLEQSEAANTHGIVNPESAKAGLTTQPLPEISQQTFKPPPSAITGSYKEPAKKKDSTKSDSAK